MAATSRPSAPAGAALVVAALAAATLLVRDSGSQRPLDEQVFLQPLPPAPATASPLRVSAASGSLDSQGPQPSAAVPAAAVIAAAAALATAGLAARRSTVGSAAPRRASVVVAASASDEAAEEDDEEDFADDDAYEFDEDDEDDFYDEDEEDDELEATCQARFLKGNPLKFRRVLWQIRGRSYRDALMLLEFMPWRACKPVLSAVQSAAANAQNQFNMDKSRLYIKKCYAEKGPTSKRMRPVAKGQMHPFMRRSTHLTIKVAEMSDSQLAELDFA